MKTDGEDAVFTWLEKLGYDRDLYSVKSRLFTVTFHSRALGAKPDTPKMEVKVRDAIGTDIDNIANKLVLQRYGEDIEKAEGYRIVEKDNS